MKWIITLLRCCLPSMAAALLVFAAPGAVRAEQVIDRIARTRIFNAGTRADAIPFGYRNKKGQLVGFSVDLLGEIRKKLEQQLGHPIEMRLQVTTPSTRMELVNNGAIDIECGITTPTWERHKIVDFSIPFFGNGTRVMTLRTTAMRLDELRGKRIGVVTGTTTTRILSENLPDAVVVEVPSMDAGLAMFSRGELDGLSNVGIVLRASVEGNPLKSKVVLLPRTGALSYESIACILPHNDSDWRDFVNHMLAELIDGVDDYRGAYMEIYERWFGPRGVVFFPLDYTVAQQLAASIIWLK
ncbi:MAG: amino acid ABC transporter substrate-binding protein [Candidatus Competibacteraceae bacterium]